MGVLFYNMAKNRLLNIFDDLTDYNLEKFKSDLNAGLVTGIIAVPLSLALAIATGVPPIIGLYTAVSAGILASVFAGSRFSVSGPAAAMVPVLAAIITEYGIDSLPLIGILAGIFLALFGLLRLGNFIKYVPLSVTLGFTAGIAVTLFFGQLNSFMGLSGITPHETFLEKTIETFEKLPSISWATLIIGLIGLLIQILLPKVKVLSKIPASFVAVVVGSLLVTFIPFFGNVKTIQDIYGQLQPSFNIPYIYIPGWRGFTELVVPALKIAFLISIESLLCAVVADKMTKTRHNSNKELIAQGIANIFTPMFGGIPSTAVIARTGTSIKNGAKTRVAAFIHAIIVLLFLIVLAFLPALGGAIPLAVLSSILFITAWKISEQKEIRELINKAPKSDIGILFLTFFLTIFMDLTIAVGVGMFIAVIFIFSRLSTLYGENVTADRKFIDQGLRDLLANNEHIQFINVEGNLSMGSAGDIKDRIKVSSNTQKVILRMRGIHHIDLSGLEALKDFIEDLKAEGKEVYLTSLNNRFSYKLDRFGILDKVDGVYESTNAIVLSLK